MFGKRSRITKLRQRALVRREAHSKKADREYIIKCKVGFCHAPFGLKGSLDIVLGLIPGHTYVPHT